MFCVHWYIFIWLVFCIELVRCHCIPFKIRLVWNINMNYWPVLLHHTQVTINVLKLADFPKCKTLAKYVINAPMHRLVFSPHHPVKLGHLAVKACER